MEAWDMRMVRCEQPPCSVLVTRPPGITPAGKQSGFETGIVGATTVFFPSGCEQGQSRFTWFTWSPGPCAFIQALKSQRKV